MNHIYHGFLGKITKYTKQGFQEKKPLTIEERKEQVLLSQKSWKYDPSKVKLVGGYVQNTPPVETYYLLTAEGDVLQTETLDNLLWTT